MKHIYPDGTIRWSNSDNKLDRVFAPSLLWIGVQAWFIDGVSHREDGPSMLNPRGRQAWTENGEHTKPLADTGLSIMCYATTADALTNKGVVFPEGPVILLRQVERADGPVECAIMPTPNWSS
jgi:hypothetical protein